MNVVYRENICFMFFLQLINVMCIPILSDPLRRTMAGPHATTGFYVSVGGIVTFGKDLQATVKKIPLEQMLLETDAPYLTPAPEKNHTIKLKTIYYPATLLMCLTSHNTHNN